MKFSPQDSSQDELWMRAALEWAAKGKGWTSPRPSVGCVLVRGDKIIGGGHTQPGDGQPHAEVMALRVAQQNDPQHAARGATAYVTLEPCSHWATTPPCSDALIKNGIVRVVAGVIDPNPLIAGRGFQKLRDAKIEVVEGVLERECRRAHDDFLKHIVAKKPFVTLKCAVSLDGKIALQNGESKWITGDEARRRGHILRHHHDAVLAGIGTVLADDPLLSVRLDGHWKQPARVVLDSRGRLPLDARLWNAGPQLIIATTSKISGEREREFAERGAVLVKTKGPRVDWETLLAALYERKICSVLIEGGAKVAGSALAAGIVDKVVFFVAPMLIGEGQGAVQGFEAEKLALAPRLRDVEIERVGDDVMIEGYLGSVEK